MCPSKALAFFGDQATSQKPRVQDTPSLHNAAQGRTTLHILAHSPQEAATRSRNCRDSLTPSRQVGSDGISTVPSFASFRPLYLSCFFSGMALARERLNAWVAHVKAIWCHSMTRSPHWLTIPPKARRRMPEDEKIARGLLLGDAFRGRL